MDARVAQAIAALQPESPVYLAGIDEDSGKVTLYLASKTLHYTPDARPAPRKKPQKPPPQPDDFTCIPYVGKEIAQALNNAGYRTFDDLVKAPDTALLDLPHISAHTLGKIRTYLKEHYL